MLHSGELCNKGFEQLQTLCLYSSEGPNTLVSAYAPTLFSTPGAKDKFYENLNADIRTTPSQDQFVLLGDFYARMGADHDSW